LKVGFPLGLNVTEGLETTSSIKQPNWYESENVPEGVDIR
jgi:hypothetical protein